MPAGVSAYPKPTDNLTLIHRGHGHTLAKDADLPAAYHSCRTARSRPRENAATAAAGTDCLVARLGAPRIPVGYAAVLEAISAPMRRLVD